MSKYRPRFSLSSSFSYWLYWGNIVAIMFKAKPRPRNLFDARPINTSFTVTDTATSVDAVTFTNVAAASGTS